MLSVFAVPLPRKLQREPDKTAVTATLRRDHERRSQSAVPSKPPRQIIGDPLSITVRQMARWPSASLTSPHKKAAHSTEGRLP